MSLAIQLNVLAPDPDDYEDEGRRAALRAELASINRVLSRKGYPTFDEPTIAIAAPRRAISSFPYSYLHRLRRAYTLHFRELELQPPKGPPLWLRRLGFESNDALRKEEALIEDLSGQMCVHLLTHSDCAGWYVPVELPEIVFDDELPGGGMLGSSYALRRELLSVALPLEIDLQNEQPTDAATALLANHEHQRGHRLGIERLVWFSLWEAVQISVQHGTAIAFR